uniref:Uncharacterized protein n=1 Tax=Candidatus Kentrum sp. DK TaxID=2126562 RepID=A0A450SEK2_9GAMM|nr:MAG: hypothetical protein BECKDK2373C_GA0170839_103124 [Candidatus Kentron sp. DK]
MGSEPQNKVERGTRSLSDLGVRREGKRDRDQNLCKFEANSELFNENLRGFWPISAFPQQNHPKSDRLLVQLILNPQAAISRVEFPPSAGYASARSMFPSN